MILKEDEYFNIIHVIVESATSGEEEFGFATIMDDIPASLVGEWKKTDSEYDKQRVIEEFNPYNTENELRIEDLDTLEAQQNFYPVNERYFSGGLNLERPVYLGIRQFRLPKFKYDGEEFENVMVASDFDLFYKENEEYIQIEFK